MCLCQFYFNSDYNRQNGSGYQYPLLESYQYSGLELINQLSYFTVNFIFLVALIFMVYRIRHTQDNTRISVECAYICLWWVVCSTLQFIIFILLKANLCQELGFTTGNGTVTLSYYSSVVRNFITMVITVYFQLRVNRDQSLHQVVSTGGHDNTQAIMDFDILLESVYPHKQFSEFIRLEKPEMLPFLTIVRKAKLLRGI